MYCQCFSEGRYCSDCNCINCQNLPNNVNLKKRVRLLNKGESKFWHEAISKESFDCQSHNSEAAVKSCNCTRSKCLKGYCDCFNAGKFCNEFCKCCNCCNKVLQPQSKVAIPQVKSLTITIGKIMLKTIKKKMSKSSRNLLFPLDLTTYLCQLEVYIHTFSETHMKGIQKISLHRQNLVMNS